MPNFTLLQPATFLHHPLPLYPFPAPMALATVPLPLLPFPSSAFLSDPVEQQNIVPLQLSPPPPPPARTAEMDAECLDILQLLQELSDPCVREMYIEELLEKRGNSKELAPMVWHSVGSMACLIDDIVSGYFHIDPPKINLRRSAKVCTTLKLFQCVALHPETQPLFVNANMHMLLYPYLNTPSNEDPAESLRQGALSVILALVKESDAGVVCYLFSATPEILPLCFRILKADVCTNLTSKFIAADILRKVLLTDFGLLYICHNRFTLTDITVALCKLVKHLHKTKQLNSQKKLLKCMIQCFLRLTDDITTRELLRNHIPVQLKESKCCGYFKDDATTREWLSLLWKNLKININVPTTKRESNSKKNNSSKKVNPK